MEYLKNPWVIGGVGVVLALLFLMRGSGSSSSGQVGYDQASLSLIGEEAQLNAGIEQSQIAASSANVSTIAAAIGNLVNAKYAYMLGSQQVEAGITNARIGADTAVRIDKMHETTARIQAQYGYSLGINQSNNNLAAVHIQADTAKAIQSNNNTFGLIGNILGAIGL